MKLKWSGKVHTMKRSAVLSILMLMITQFLVSLAACSGGSITSTGTGTPSIPTPISFPTKTESAANDSTAAEVRAFGEVNSIEDVATVVAQRTPIPTRYPSEIRERADEIAHEAGLDEISLLGLPLVVWIDLAISVMIIVLLVFVILKLLLALVKAIVRRTSTEFDDQFLAYIEPQLRWLVVIIVTGQVAIARLGFLSDRMKLLLEDVFFLLALVFLYIIVLRLIHYGSVWYRRNKLSADQRRQLGPFIETVTRLAYLLVTALSLSAALSHYGVEITVLSVIVLFVAAVVVIGAKAAVTDAISGFIILLSQPFRVKDTIFIKELNTRGVVQEIGIRTTLIRTRDGREVIVPNSLISASQVVNFTYPDPYFRVEVDFLINGADIDTVDELITQAVRSVDGVLPDKPVDALYLAFGGSGRQIRVRWWIDDVNQHNRSRDKVNRALDKALSQAGIESPNLTYDLNLKMDDKDGQNALQIPPHRSATGQETEE